MKEHYQRKIEESTKKGSVDSNTLIELER